MRKLVVMILCATLAFTQSFAQNRTVTGKVTDDKGAAIAGASVVAKSSKGGTTTAADGTFKLTVPNTVKVLTISSLNYVQKDVTIAANNTANASLVTSAADALDEVVVVGYGSAKKKSDATGSVVTVNAERLQDRPSANILDALQGQVPGLQVFTSNGEPSTTPSVRLNGVGSLGSSSTPLYVLDGVAINAGTIISLNPEDFESITVLKDASATSIYGSRAANGVIYITSKKGKINNSKISIQSQYGVSNLVKPTTDYFNSMMNAQQLGAFEVGSGLRTATGLQTLRNLYGADVDTKWYKYYYRENAPTSQLDLNISGGGGRTTYYVSGSAFKQQGLAYRSDYERYTFRANVNSAVNNWMKMGVNISGGHDERMTNAYSSAANTNGGLSILNLPYYPTKDANGVDYPNLIPGLQQYNPQYLQDMNPSVGRNLTLNSSAFVSINPFNGLIIKTQTGIDFYDYHVQSKRLPSNIASLNNGSTSESFTRSSLTTITNTAEYSFKVKERNSFVLLAGQEYVYNNVKGLSGSSTGQTDDRLTLISAGPTNYLASSSKTEYAYTSYFGRLNYNLDSKYFVDLSVRNDLSSRFGRELRGATFYSAGLMWKAKKEKFLQNVKWIDDLTFKGSLGTSGNSSVGDYQSLALVGTNLYNTGSGFGVSSPGNPQLSWETQKQTNIGIQATLFKKLNVDVEYFNRITNNMVISVPYPYSSGWSTVTSNVGSLKNSGFNANVNYDFIKKKSSFLNVYVNVGYVEQKITELFQGRQYWIIPNTGVAWAVGQPVNFFYPIFAGIDPANGDATWYRPNADPNKVVETTKGATTNVFNTVGLQQNLGIARVPPLNGGFGFSARHREFSVNADFSFSQGKYLLNNDRYFTENGNVFGGSYNQSYLVNDYWKKPGDITRFPRWNVQQTQFDSRLIENASFLRLKNLTFAYDFSKTLLDKQKVISGARLYVTGRNIWTLTNYTGPDPEVDSNLSIGANPNTSQIVVGFNLQF
jgi:TonB-linked SusC/RagA family outer membrane protein